MRLSTIILTSYWVTGAPLEVVW